MSVSEIAILPTALHSNTVHYPSKDSSVLMHVAEQNMLHLIYVRIESVTVTIGQTAPSE